ncbi:phage protein GemA/Gp16 family protein [Cellulosilyticum sp. I15G10I2]|uniref:phage protein GemA/Gp16 family protein n=1 Tax=Cellulosilyticum sp. I15G10I2 TaxID=1892843 RepID=UPI00085BF867|nr:phage protein GemA/Gp16 family protein [Cellulosilyticum sp. I15G10I2]
MHEITYPQMRKLYALAKQKGLDNEELHELVYQCSGKESIKQLSKSEGIRLIDRLEVKRVSPQGRITPSQESYMNDLIEQLGWNDNPKRLKGFIRKYAKVDEIRWLTVKQASNIIEGLKRQVKEVVVAEGR